ncbi:hypothetical protein EVAR_31532_1 [Eumeta japonica]|uniref:Uncharacterized protein n=1 Tax=Eumeta variegata TaxID=151549 RepID=A0A4C1V774_EUMVA|nr:hypothetical protein EVAR_31532_1 [Eumeta japonica]
MQSAVNIDMVIRGNARGLEHSSPLCAYVDEMGEPPVRVLFDLNNNAGGYPFRKRSHGDRLDGALAIRTVYTAKYTGEFNIQFRLNNSERSWSTMQEIVPRNKIARNCRPRNRATPRLLAPSKSSPATRDNYLRVDLNNTEQTRVSGAVDR